MLQSVIIITIGETIHNRYANILFSKPCEKSKERSIILSDSTQLPPCLRTAWQATVDCETPIGQIARLLLL